MGALTHEIDVNITAVSLDEYGYANSEFVASEGIVLLADPENGYVYLVNIETEQVTSISLDGTFPQSMRVTVDPVTEHVWVVTRDGHAYMIHLDDAAIEAQYQLEGTVGTNFVIATITPETSEHEHEGQEHEHEDHDHELYDPHTWISPYIARQQAESIYDALVEKDPEHADYYAQQWNLLQQRFTELDTAFQEGLSTKQKNAIFVTHAAFGYLADRYGFHQHGVIGLSADEQPSASTIATLVSTMIEHEIYVVYVDPVYSDDYAQTLKSTLESETGENVQILKLYLMAGTVDSMEYFEQLEKNLENLQIGLQAS
jgi:zinc transport system substrate-binding protein